MKRTFLLLPLIILISCGGTNETITFIELEKAIENENVEKVIYSSNNKVEIILLNKEATYEVVNDSLLPKQLYRKVQQKFEGIVDVTFEQK